MKYYSKFVWGIPPHKEKEHRLDLHTESRNVGAYSGTYLTVSPLHSASVHKPDQVTVAVAQATQTPTKNVATQDENSSDKKYSGLAHQASKQVARHLNAIMRFPGFDSIWSQLPDHLIELVFLYCVEYERFPYSPETLCRLFLLIESQDPQLSTDNQLFVGPCISSLTELQLDGLAVASSSYLWRVLGQNNISWPKLKVISVKDVQISDKLLSRVFSPKLSSLQKFEARSNIKLGDKTIQKLVECCGNTLTHINLNFTSMRIAGLWLIFSKCQKLQTLKVASTDLGSDKSIKEAITGEVSRMASVSSVKAKRVKLDLDSKRDQRFTNMKFRSTKFGNFSLKSVIDCFGASLKVLDIMDTTVTSLQHFCSTEHSLSKIRKINISGLSIQNPQYLLDFTKKICAPDMGLEELLVGRLTVLNDALFAQCAPLFAKKLKRLSLFGNVQLSDISTLITCLLEPKIDAPESISPLEDLDLSHTSVDSSSFALSTMAPLKTFLRSLSLSQTKIDDLVCMDFLPLACPKMGSLDLSGTKITKEGLKTVMIACKDTIKWINVEGCRGIPVIERKSIVENIWIQIHQ